MLEVFDGQEDKKTDLSSRFHDLPEVFNGDEVRSDFELVPCLNPSFSPTELPAKIVEFNRKLSAGGGRCGMGYDEHPWM